MVKIPPFIESELPKVTIRREDDPNLCLGDIRHDEMTMLYFFPDHLFRFYITYSDAKANELLAKVDDPVVTVDEMIDFLCRSERASNSETPMTIDDFMKLCRMRRSVVELIPVYEIDIEPTTKE